MEIITEKRMKLDLKNDERFIMRQIGLFFHENKDNLEIKKTVRPDNTTYLLTNSVTYERFLEDINFRAEFIHIIKPKKVSQLQLGDIKQIIYVETPKGRFELEFCTAQTTSQPDPYSESSVIKNEYEIYKVFEDSEITGLYKNLMNEYLFFLGKNKEKE